MNKLAKLIVVMNRIHLWESMKAQILSFIQFNFVFLITMFLTLIPSVNADPGNHPWSHDEKMTLSLRNVEITEAMEMLSRKQRVNILLSEDVDGKVSVNLYDSTVGNAINAIANAAGYQVEKRGENYFVIDHEDVGRYADSETTKTKTYKLRYAQSADVMEILEGHLSLYGSISELSDRNMLVIEDKPEFLSSIEKILEKIDYKPKQILIEARILEIRLDESENFGIDWSRVFEGGDGLVGTRGLSQTSSGLFVEFTGTRLNVFLDALEEEGRAKTLSTPKLLTLENQSASVIVGDRLGYVNTVTINQVTSETTEFLESGVILEVTPSVDSNGNIMLDIHPEISTGSVNDGIPSQDTTSVQTHLLVPNGSTSFIGGLIRSQVFSDRSGVPVLGQIPLAGKLFSRKTNTTINREVIILITPTIVNSGDFEWQERELNEIKHFDDSEYVDLESIIAAARD